MSAFFLLTIIVFILLFLTSFQLITSFITDYFRCLEKNPEHRPYMAELEEHPFIQSVPENDYHVSLF